jgi:hypothetical protein
LADYLFGEAVPRAALTKAVSPTGIVWLECNTSALGVPVEHRPTLRDLSVTAALKMISSGWVAATVYASCKGRVEV